jgi:LacI family transcriptional regulator
MHALARRGIQVPAQVAVTGFDDVPVARHLHPPLTTVRQPIQQLGATAFDVLYSRISATSGRTDVVLPVQVIVRASCGCAQ